ncbi:MAG: tail fiber domain-containing protein [Ginsengibacter sp.]
MKQFLLLLLVIFAGSYSMAQSPEQMSYQAVVRNDLGKVLIEKPVGIKVSILHNTDAGVSVFTETQATTTNKNGLLTISIGGGTIISGNISAIDWSDGPYFLKTEIDPDGGNAYSLTNVSQMLSTPYALYAKSAGESIGGWNVNGNAATSGNFLGTTNTQPLTFKVNNTRVGYLGDGLDNTFFGIEAAVNNTTGNSNAALGNSALKANTTGSENVAIGFNALTANTTGGQNIANGAWSLYSNVDGYYNTAMGIKALYSNTQGFYNHATGFHSLYANTTGSGNIASGYYSMLSNVTGDDNVGLGDAVMYLNTTGSNNVAIGNEALFNNGVGFSNVAIGKESLHANLIGSFNTAIGSNTDVVGNITNATALGHGALVNASNKVRIGNTDVTTIEGQVAFSFPSDSRFKYNIQHNVPGLDFIEKLQPVTYYFDNEKLDQFTRTGVINKSNIYPVFNKGEKEIHTGFLAQDVEKTANELGYHFDGIRAPSNDKDHYSLAYSQFIMPLVKGMQEQQAIIEKLQSTVEKLEKQIDNLTKK